MIDFPKAVYLTQDADVFALHIGLPTGPQPAVAIYALHQVRRMKPEAVLDLKDEAQVATLRTDLATHVATLRELAASGDKRAMEAAINELANLLPDEAPIDTSVPAEVVKAPAKRKLVRQHGPSLEKLGRR